MKIFKKIIIVLIVIFVAGCSNKAINNVYDSMKAGTGEKDINGYSIDLRIYGVVKEQTINEIVRISNFRDEDFKITIVNKELSPLNEEEIAIENNDTVIYVIDGKTYALKDGDYVETKEVQIYSNPLIYLEGLKNIKSVESDSEELIGDNKYIVYNVKIKKDFIKKILEEINLSVTIDENIDAKIYENEEGYLYRIIYYIDDLTVNVNYYGINNSTEILLP